MHTYYTALPFTPRHTRFYRLYKQETHHSITVLQGLDPLWTSCLANLVMKDGTSIVRISPDGTRLAVGGRHNISLWDTRTTALQRYLHIEYFFFGLGDRNKNSLAISFSESTVATVWRGTLFIWDATTATKRVTRELSGNSVHAAAFSFGGQYLLLSIVQRLHLYRFTDVSELPVLSTNHHHTIAIFTWL